LLQHFARTLTETFGPSREAVEAGPPSVDFLSYALDPLGLSRILWPQAVLAGYQEDIVRSVWDNDETIVVAGNMLGKDYIAGMIAVLFFLTRTPCRIITTSADYSQLESVLWGEIGRFISDSAVPLESSGGGPLLVNHLHVRKLKPDGSPCRLSYLKGRVAAKGEGMLGHHVARERDGIPRTLWMADECSGVDDKSYDRSETWAHRKLGIGNPYDCANFFRRGVEGGDLVATK